MKKSIEDTENYLNDMDPYTMGFDPYETNIDIEKYENSKMNRKVKNKNTHSIYSSKCVRNIEKNIHKGLKTTIKKK